MDTPAQVAALMLLAAVLQCCSADGHQGDQKKVVIFVPQKVRTIHHHHVSSEVRKHKGQHKDEEQVLDSWSFGDNHASDGEGTWQGGEVTWPGAQSSGAQWTGAQGYIGPPGSALGHSGQDDHGGMHTSGFFSGGEDAQGTESARHEVRGGHRASFRDLQGKRYISGGFSSEQGPIAGLEGDVRSAHGFAPAGNQVFDGVRIPHFNMAGLGSEPGLRGGAVGQRGYSLGSSQAPTPALVSGGYSFGSGENRLSGYNHGHRGYSTGGSGDLPSGSSNVLRVYNSMSSKGPSSGLQGVMGYNPGASHGVSADSHSLDGYSPDSGYATLRGSSHRGAGSGHLGLVSGSLEEGSLGGFSSEGGLRVLEEVPGWKGWKGWKGTRGGPKRKPSGDRHLRGNRGSAEDMKALGSSHRPVASRPRKKDGKRRKGSRRRPVKFPDDEPRTTRSKRHHQRRAPRHSTGKPRRTQARAWPR